VSRGDIEDSLVDAVLARTSGPACSRATELVPGIADGTLEGTDAALVRLHLERCGECAAIARVLAALPADLAALAELRPDAGFARDVLARTSRRSRRAAGIWQRLVLRPRLALEGAYVGAVVVFALVGLGGTPLREASRDTLAIASTNPVRAAAGPVERLATDAEIAAARARASVDAAVPAALENLERTWSGTTAPLVRAAGRVRHALGELWNGAEAVDPDERTKERPT
jgi:hypothetical protein